MCAHGMYVDTSEGKQLALKATGWMTNSEHVLKEVSKMCTNCGGPNDHAHASLQQHNSQEAAVYPEALCYAILRGLRKQLTKSHVMSEGEIGSVCESHEEKQFQRTLEHGEYFVDDVSGEVLDSKLVLEARLDEKLGVQKWNLFDFCLIYQRFL